MLFHKLGLGGPEPEDFAWFYHVKARSNDHGIYYFNKFFPEGIVRIEGIQDNMGPFKNNFFYAPSPIAGNFRELSKCFNLWSCNLIVTLYSLYLFSSNGTFLL